MGSFNVKCGLTGVNIEPGDQAYIFFMRESKFNPTRHSIKSMFGTGLFVSNNGPTHFYELDSMSILTSYGDYGHFNVLNPEEDNFKLYIEHHKMGIPDNHILDAQKLNFFVVHKKAYDFVTNTSNYEDVSHLHFLIKMANEDFENLCEQVEVLSSDATPLLKKFAYDIIDTYQHRVSYAYNKIYSYDSNKMRTNYLDNHLMLDAMLRTGRFYHCPVYGEPDSNIEFLKNLYQSL